MPFNLNNYLSCCANKAVKKEGESKRIDNIDSFSRINREGLLYGESERMMLLYTTQNNEKIYIRYPGKETINPDMEKAKPWDFRPKIKRENGTFVDDLAFLDIWSDIEHLFNRLSDDDMAKLSAIFYRALIMKDSVKVEENCNIINIDVANNDNETYAGVERLTWNKMTLPIDVITEINNIFGNIRGVSFEAYLYYNDLLCQNEDCKYYYKATYIDKKKWNKSVGRKNTLLTHLLILAYLKGQVELVYLADKFIRGKGVGPLEEAKVAQLTNGLITFE